MCFEGMRDISCLHCKNVPVLKKCFSKLCQIGRRDQNEIYIVYVCKLMTIMNV